MFSHVVVYSPLHTLSPSFVQKLGLLYDRVVLPLPDSIRSNRIEWLLEVAQNCSYTQSYLNRLRAFYDSDCEFCRPLEPVEYPALSLSSDKFNQKFFRFVNRNVPEEQWEQLLNNSINIVQDILNFFVTQDYIAANEYTQIVFPYQEHGANNQRLVDKLADILKVEAMKCALHDFKLPSDPLKFGQVIKFSRTIESRYSLMSKITKSAQNIEDAGYDEDNKEELKKVIRNEVLQLAMSYNRYLVDLAQYNEYVEIDRCKGSSTLRLGRRLVRPKARVVKMEANIARLGSASVMFNQDPYTIYYEHILKDSMRIHRKLAGCRWQRDLLTFRCDFDRDFDRTETYKRSSQTNFWRHVMTMITK